MERVVKAEPIPLPRLHRVCSALAAIELTTDGEHRISDRFRIESQRVFCQSESTPPRVESDRAGLGSHHFPTNRLVLHVVGVRLAHTQDENSRDHHDI